MATENAVIPPRSESVILVSLIEEVASSWGSVEPLKSANAPRDVLVNLQCPTSLPVRIMNLSDNARHIIKGKHLAVEYAIDEELGSRRTDYEESEASDVPAHLVDLYERSKSNLSKEQSKQLKNLLVEYQDVFSRYKNDLSRTGYEAQD